VGEDLTRGPHLLVRGEGGRRREGMGRVGRKGSRVAREKRKREEEERWAGLLGRERGLD
jgi:hypothetical protein